MHIFEKRGIYIYIFNCDSLNNTFKINWIGYTVFLIIPTQFGTVV